MYIARCRCRHHGKIARGVPSEHLIDPERGVSRLRARQDKGYRLPAFRHPLGRGSEVEKEGRTRAQQRAAGKKKKKTALFDIVKMK